MNTIHSTDIPGISIELGHAYIVVRIETESALTMLYHVQEEVLRHIETYTPQYVIIDFSEVMVNNPSLYFSMCSTCRIVSLMAEQTIITGIDAAMAASFYMPDNRLSSIMFLDSVDAAIQYFSLTANVKHSGKLAAEELIAEKM